MTEQRTSPAPQGKRYALVIGVNNAPESGKSPLKWAEQDAKDMARILRQPYCNFDPVVELIGDNANIANIASAIDELLDKKNAEDLLLLYFAGHGIQTEQANGDAREVFLAVNGFSRARAQRDPSRQISLNWLRNMCYYQTNAQHVIVILDCCYSGFVGVNPVEPTLVQLYQTLERYFNIEGKPALPPVKGSRNILASVGPDEEARERNGHGVMTGLILDALEGKGLRARDSEGFVTPTQLLAFLEERMRQIDVPHPHQLGVNTSAFCFLATHEPPSTAQVAGHPALEYFVPRTPSLVFQKRPNEIEQLLSQLIATPRKIIGLVGMTGIGKSQLAVQVAQKYREQFKGRVYWINADGQSRDAWRDSFAALARQLNFRPDPSVNDAEALATHMAGYLARNQNLLLILDNVEDPQNVIRFPVELAGDELQCSVLYTSLSQQRPDNVETHHVPLLSDPQAWRLLLPSQYSVVLEKLEANRLDEEAQSAVNICRYLHNHPMALNCMRVWLLDDPERTLADLVEEMRRVGILALSDEVPGNTYPDLRTLRMTFQMLWDRITDSYHRLCFKLAAFYPDTTAIPLWQLSIAADSGSDESRSSRIHSCALRLAQLSLVDYLREHRLLQLHPLVKDFALSRTDTRDSDERKLLEASGQRMTTVLDDLALLKQRAHLDYWTCLEQVRTAISYIYTLTGIAQQRLSILERYLDQESYLLATSDLWPNQLPTLFHQQFHNRALEERFKLHEDEPGSYWLALQRPVGLKRQLEGERTFSFSGGPVTAVAFSPVAREILLGSEDGIVRLLNADNGHMLASLDGHNAAITAVVFSSDGSYLLTASSDHSIRLWHWQRAFSQCLFLRSFVHSDEVISAAISPDTRFLLGGLKNGTAWLWERASDQPVRILEAGRALTGVAFVPPQGTQLLTVTSDMTIQIWERDSGRSLLQTGLKQELVWDRYRYGRFSYQLRNMLTGDLVEEQALSGSEQLRTFYCLACSPDGKRILTGANNGTALLWDIDSGQLLHIFSGHQVMVTAVAFSPDRERILTGSGDGTTRLWDIASRQQLAIFQQSARVTGTAFAPDSQQILTGLNTSQARLWRIRSQSSTMATTRESALPVTSIALINLRVQYLYALVGTANGEAMLWHYVDDEWKQVRRNWQAQDGPLTSVAISPVTRAADRFLLLSASDADSDSVAKMWEVISNKPLQPPIRTFNRHTDGMSAVFFLPDKETLLTASFDGTVCLWKVREQPDAQRRHPFRVLDASPRRPVHCVAISSDGRQIVGGMDNGQIEIWSATQNKGNKKTRGRNWQGHTNQVTCLAFLSGDRFIFSSALDGSNRLWDATTGTQVGELTGLHEEIEHAAGSPDGTYLLTCDRRGNYARLWKMSITDGNVSGALCALYPAYSRIGAILWLDNQHFILADIGGTEGRPYFHHLSIEAAGI